MLSKNLNVKSFILFFLCLIFNTNILNADLNDNSNKINKIKIFGNKHVKKYLIINKLPWKVGENFDETKTAMTINNIYSLGYFKQIKIEKEILKNSKVNLFITVEEKDLLANLEFEGNKTISSDKIRKELALDKLITIDDETLEKISTGIKKLYADESFHNIKIETKIIPDAKIEKKSSAKFIITEGIRSVIVSVNFVGNNQISDRKLRKMISTREEWLLGFLDDAGKYKKDDLEMDKHRIEYIYKDLGYLTTSVPKVDVDFSEQDKKIKVTFHIKEGDQFIIAKINTVVDDEVSDSDQREYITLDENKPYCQSKMLETITNLKNLWGKLGYINADVYPQVIPDEQTKTVEINFDVEKGKKIYVNRIDISGNTYTRDKVIRRQIDLEEGDLITTKKLNASQANVEYLSYFERGGVNWKIHRLSEDKANLEMNIKETKTGSANIGLTYGSDRFNPQPSVKVRGNIEKKNLFGLGFDVGGTIQASRHHIQDISATFFDPAILDSDSSVFATIYKRWEEYEQWTNVTVMPKEKTTGGSGRFGFYLPQLDKRLQFLTELGIESISNNNPHAKGPNAAIFEPIVRQKFQEGTLAWLCFDLIKDTRNHKVYPNSGYKTILHTKLAPPAVNEEYSFLKAELEGSWYTPLIGDDNLVLGMHAKFGVVEPVGGTYYITQIDSDGIASKVEKRKIIPYKELFNMGGQDTVRGFVWGSIGPAWTTGANDQNGSPMGSKYMFQFNAELIFPLIPDYSMKGHFFYDAGAGWDTPKDAITQEDRAYIKRDRFKLRHAVGFGLNLTQPVPAKIDWGYKLDRDKAAGESPSEFHISMNYAF
ncbi:outer membrane protein assembly factor BamA [Candidatus Dependentiae bacterium]|nr:outer membrane protein assembly factor BamA [Candidatus Dependentiae bacterium]MBU4387748.1 outer membrane protein assembly factor BamA [Candidatus Dependentiae bacterium]MCG2756340.1 outer membrane protein assembly factor BamA [Candidatus Dependentiae bacterium]